MEDFGDFFCFLVFWNVLVVEVGGGFGVGVFVGIVYDVFIWKECWVF